VRWLVLVVLASCVAQEPKWTATASCTVRSDTGTECFEYDLSMPAERDQLRAQCSAPGSTFAESDSCETDNRIGGCVLDKGLLHGTFIYTGYQDVASFMQGCTNDGGTWNP
jgi:hypothetical protein